MKKIIGYVLSGIGIVGLAIGLRPELQKSIPQLAGIPELGLFIGSAVVILLGLLMIVKGGGRQGKKHKSKNHTDLPIFKDKNIVGYRRD